MVLLLLLLLLNQISYAEPAAVVEHPRLVFLGVDNFCLNHFVGGSSSGWTPGPNFTDCALHETFTNQDCVVFLPKNGTHHQVLEVSQAAYQRCATDHPVKNWTSPNWEEAATVVKLVSSPPGRYYYYIAGKDECLKGMKFAFMLDSGAPYPAEVVFCIGGGCGKSAAVVPPHVLAVLMMIFLIIINNIRIHVF